MGGISAINVYVFSVPRTTKRQHYSYNFGISGNGLKSMITCSELKENPSVARGISTKTVVITELVS